MVPVVPGAAPLVSFAAPAPSILAMQFASTKLPVQCFGFSFDAFRAVLAEPSLTEGFSVVVGFAGEAGDWVVSDSGVVVGFCVGWRPGLCPAQTSPHASSIGAAMKFSILLLFIGNNSSFSPNCWCVRSNRAANSNRKRFAFLPLNL